MDNRTDITVLGAGSWGTAIAISLSGNGHRVSLWDIDQAHLLDMKKTRENRKYLPGVTFPETLVISESRRRALEEAKVVIFSVPAQHFRKAAREAKEEIPQNAVIVNTAKGIEQDSLMRLSQIALQELGEVPYVVISGPSHAEEVSRGLPTTLVSASQDRELAQRIQDLFMSPCLRVYTSSDVIGVELGGALKNIIALGAGISDGMGFGDNAKAAMMTRGIAEMARLGVAMGADEKTFGGLSGIGDLIVTCTSMHSRNRRCGILIGEGVSPQQAISQVGMVVEGMYTAKAAYELAKRYEVEMPITEQIYLAIQGRVDARDAVAALMGRQKRHEVEPL